MSNALVVWGNVEWFRRVQELNRARPRMLGEEGKIEEQEEWKQSDFEGLFKPKMYVLPRRWPSSIERFWNKLTWLNFDLRKHPPCTVGDWLKQCKENQLSIIKYIQLSIITLKNFWSYHIRIKLLMQHSPKHVCLLWIMNIYCANILYIP